MQCAIKLQCGVTIPACSRPLNTPALPFTGYCLRADHARELTYEQVQMMSKHKDPKTVMRYDHGRENLDQSAVNFSASGIAKGSSR